MLKILASLFVLTAACSSNGTSDCSTPRCPNDPVPSQQSIDSCTKQQGTCSSACKTESSCYNTKVKGQVCGADGKTDSSKYLAAVGMCPIGAACQACLAK